MSTFGKPNDPQEVVPSGGVVVVGMGEVGRPLFRILSKSYECVPVDLNPVQVNSSCSVMHICYPFQIPNFVQTTVSYIRKYNPALVVINSTVAPGTTREIERRVHGTPVVYSPVRGKHAVMESDMLRYKKYVGATKSSAAEDAMSHFRKAGFTTARFRTPEIAELTKLLETTYLGVLIAWTQEMERFTAQYGASFGEVNTFFEEIAFLPAHIFPGEIGGHCVMPNIEILRTVFDSKFLAAVVESNDLKRLQPAAATIGGRV